MLYSQDLTATDALRQAIRDAYRVDETQVLEQLLAADELSAIDRANIWQRARAMVLAIRAGQHGQGGVDALLQEFSLSTDEGIVLMCLAEALLRVPDKATMDSLIRDKLADGGWDKHLGNSDSLFVNASAWGLLLTGKMVNYNDERKRQQFGLLKQALGRVGEPVIRQAIRYAMQVMGTQFVLGTSIGEALSRARVLESKGYRYSYDMLGEGARTAIDAQRYFNSYMQAIESIGQAANGLDHRDSPGISVKLSAIHPRFEFSQRQRVLQELVPRLKELALAAKKYNIGFTVDAEEADRLDLSMEVIEAVYLDADLAGWQGFGLAVQAYQKRASLLIDWLVALARRGGRQIMVRLVKGAYWDSEIKWSQEAGLDAYPVFTRKASTDVAYQICAQKLLAARDCIYPQFATHNAYTVASILTLASNHQPGNKDLDYKTNDDKTKPGFEFQRLHGMGEALYQQVMAQDGIACRIYAPVGEHADLLAYLVRRLLENGANSSFVNNIVDAAVPVESLLQDPVKQVQSWSEKNNKAIPLPIDLYRQEFKIPRKNSAGIDLSDVNHLQKMKAAMAGLLASRVRVPLGGNEQAVSNPAKPQDIIGSFRVDDSRSIENKLQQAQQAFAGWSAVAAMQRAELLEKFAQTLEQHRDELLLLCINEAGKTLADAVAELREAVDFCRYYSKQHSAMIAGDKPGESPLPPRGVVLCISPWNFPLAIFLGQVTAALMAGNTVLAKPAEQTTLIALKALELMQQVGFPRDVVQLVLGAGQAIGEQLVPDARIKAVMFTGSTATGRWINKALAQRDDNNIPLIAETGGQNAMIVDSTALPEQVVDDVIASGFQSAGQRCSALRVLFLQEDVADKIIGMIIGAMAELKLGEPQLLSTDVGPLIDLAALNRLQAHQQFMAAQNRKTVKLHFATQLPAALPAGHFFPPHLYEISSLDLLKQEVFGPVVHIVRFKARQLDDVVAQINRAGFGLTLGVHSRIQTVCHTVAANAQVGNVYINRNIIGAVVGVQPFGGRGLSGTGPKAGGPHYLEMLYRSDDEQVRQLPLGNTEPGDDKNILANAHLAQQSWQQLGAEARVNQLRRLVASLAGLRELVNDPSQLENLLEHCSQGLAQLEKCQSAKLLPGPTGENNQLSYEPRGVLLAVLDADTLALCWPHLITALAAGNALALVYLGGDDNVPSLLAAKFSQAELDQNLLSWHGSAELGCLLADRNLAGIISHGHSHDFKSALAKRSGAILPLLNSRDKFFVQRLLLEKTCSTNTTAAGGNASLMSMSED